MVCDYGRHGIVFEETPLANSRKNCAQCIATEHHAGQPLAVYCANEGRFDDVSEQIARDALKIFLSERGCFGLSHDALSEIPEFILTHCQEVETIVREVTLQAGSKRSHCGRPYGSS